MYFSVVVMYCCLLDSVYSLSYLLKFFYKLMKYVSVCVIKTKFYFNTLGIENDSNASSDL